MIFDRVRRRLAYWIHPPTADQAEQYVDLVDDMVEVKNLMGKVVPEVGLVLEWLLGKNAQYEGLAYAKYRSLAHFRDVIEYDYKRKIRNMGKD